MSSDSMSAAAAELLPVVIGRSREGKSSRRLGSWQWVLLVEEVAGVAAVVVVVWGAAKGGVLERQWRALWPERKHRMH